MDCLWSKARKRDFGALQFAFHIFFVAYSIVIFTTEFYVKAVLDTGKVMKPVEADRFPLWLRLFLLIRYILEI